MYTVTVYGASDDLIEIDGDIREEFGAYNNDGGHLAFGDGTLLSVEYNGFWRFHVIRKGDAEITKVEGTDENTDYSDKITLTWDKPIGFVLFGTNVCKQQAASPPMRPLETP